MPNSGGVDCGADCAVVEPKDPLKGAREGAEEPVGVNPKPAEQALLL